MHVTGNLLLPIATPDECARCNKPAEVTMPFMPMPWFTCGYAQCDGKLCLRWVGKSTSVDGVVRRRDNRVNTTQECQ